MKILIVAATEFELNGIREYGKFGNNSLDISFLSTGVGMVATTYELTKFFSSNKFDLAVNVGVAGTFKTTIPIGEVVEVVSDRFADLGAEDNERFLSLSEMELIGKNDFPFKDEKIYSVNSHSSSLKQVNGITVNKVHGKKSSIHKVVKDLDPDVESMEGAAFLYVCRMENTSCIQIRSISNIVESRDRSKWKIEEAIQNLTTKVVQYLKTL